MLYVICCMLYVICYMLYASYLMLCSPTQWTGGPSSGILRGRSRRGRGVSLVALGATMAAAMATASCFVGPRGVGRGAEGRGSGVGFGPILASDRIGHSTVKGVTQWSHLNGWSWGLGPWAPFGNPYRNRWTEQFFLGWASASHFINFWVLSDLKSYVRFVSGLSQFPRNSQFLPWFLSREVAFKHSSRFLPFLHVSIWAFPWIGVPLCIIQLNGIFFTNHAFWGTPMAIESPIETFTMKQLVHPRSQPGYRASWDYFETHLWGYTGWCPIAS